MQPDARRKVLLAFFAFDAVLIAVILITMFEPWKAGATDPPTIPAPPPTQPRAEPPSRRADFDAPAPGREPARSRPPAETIRDKAARDAALERIRAQRGSGAPARPSQFSEVPLTAEEAAAHESAVEGEIDHDYVRSRVRQDLIPIAVECYENLLSRDPQAQGQLVLNFTIEGEPEIGGVVSEVGVGEDSTLGDEDLRECLSEAVYTLMFPAPPQGGVVQVSYPITFAPE